MYRFGRMDPAEFIENPTQAIGKQQRRLNAAVGRNTLAAAAATFGAIMDPEIFDISTDVSRASFGALAVYTGLKAIINSHRHIALAHVASANLTQKIEELQLSQTPHQ